MAAQIDTHRRVAFASRASHEAQQKTSAAERTCIFEPLFGKKKYWNTFGAVELTEKTERAQEVVFGETPRGRRAILPRTFKHHEFYDMDDDVRLADDMQPNSELMNGYVWAAQRKKDDVIIEALDGDALEGEEGGTTKTWALDGGQEIVKGFGRTGERNGLNLSKIIEAKTLLLSKDVDPEERMYALVPVFSLREMLHTSELTSHDYQDVKALIAGTIKHAFGFEWILSNKMPDGSDSSHSYGFFYTEMAMLFGMFREVKVLVKDRPDLSDGTQVSIYGTMSSTRLHGTRMVRCDIEDANTTVIA